MFKIRILEKPRCLREMTAARNCASSMLLECDLECEEQAEEDARRDLMYVLWGSSWPRDLRLTKRTARPADGLRSGALRPVMFLAQYRRGFLWSRVLVLIPPPAMSF